MYIIVRHNTGIVGGLGMMCGCVATRGGVVGYGRVDVLGCMQV